MPLGFLLVCRFLTGDPDALVLAHLQDLAMQVSR
jgi:hypothetical protein